MKVFVILCVCVGVFAEPPRARNPRFRFQRIELAPTTTDSPTEATTEGTTDASGPYPASGWKPAGEPFKLPNEEAPSTPANDYGPPSNQYGPPANQYGPPGNQYGPPAPYPASGWKPDGPEFNLPNKEPATSYGTPDDSYAAPINTYGVPDVETTTPQAEQLDGPVEVQKSMGIYYVLLPTGELQRVDFATENDIQNMKYTARLQLNNPAPLFVFTP